MKNILNTRIGQLTKLAEQSRNKKLLWEEIQLISQKAFELQDQIMAELDRTEALETDVVKVQAAFSARESIWDLMDQITAREQELKEKAHHRETPAEREKRHREVMAEVPEHTCCCGHHHRGGCCHDEPSEHCCHQPQKTQRCHKKTPAKESGRRKICHKK